MVIFAKCDNLPILIDTYGLGLSRCIGRHVDNRDYSITAASEIPRLLREPLPFVRTTESVILADVRGAANPTGDEVRRNHETQFKVTRIIRSTR
jgi:hypothetical protein